VALLFFNLGRTFRPGDQPRIEIEEPAVNLEQLNLTPNGEPLQSGGTQTGDVAGEATAECSGKIKGNISSSGKIYHLPGGSFYERTNPEVCFASESEAIQAGFRKSLR